MFSIHLLFMLYIHVEKQCFNGKLLYLPFVWHT